MSLTDKDVKQTDKMLMNKIKPYVKKEQSTTKEQVLLQVLKVILTNLTNKCEKFYYFNKLK